MQPELEQAFLNAVKRACDDVNSWRAADGQSSLSTKLRNILLEFAADCLAEAYVGSATTTQERVRLRMHEMRRMAGIEVEEEDDQPDHPAT